MCQLIFVTISLYFLREIRIESTPLHFMQDECASSRESCYIFYRNKIPSRTEPDRLSRKYIMYGNDRQVAIVTALLQQIGVLLGVA
jgi:hypothetical protein